MQMFNFFSSFILIALVNLHLSYCNVWDNIFSQLKSPQLILPSDSQVEMFNKENKMMDLKISSGRNILKVSLLDKDLVKNITGDNSSDIVDIYVNFNNSTISFDFVDTCRYKNISLLAKFQLKFFLASYDILTLFENGDKYYEYILTNPLEKKVKKLEKSEKSEKKEKFNLKGRNLQLKFLNDENLNNAQVSGGENKFDLVKIFNIKGLMENESKIIFNVNKTTQILENVNLKIYGIDSVFMTKTTVVGNFTDEEFTLKHNCTLLEVKDE